MDHESLPFGPPDGARADLDEIRQNLLEFADAPADEDFESTGGKNSPRLIVGKKGVGKTVYLRNLRANTNDDHSVYADEVRHDVPVTEDVIKVCEMYPPNLAAESWMWIWRRAIMRSLASHILCQPKLRGRLDLDDLEQLESEFRPVLGRFRNPRSVYTEARTIAADARSRDSLKREMRHRDWDDIEDLLGRLLATLPPVCFYLDSVDEQLGTAPNYWLQCQLGLSRQVLELLRDVRFGGRLRVVVAIRDLVRSSLLQGESGTRFARTGHIRVLDWDHASIQRFLREKIHRLPPRYRMSTEGDDVRAWLGVDEIHNHRRGVTEELESYLLRHTRLIPRDIVQLGNELSVAVVAAKADGALGLQPQTIRTAVAKVAKEFADEQIAVCGNHLASDTIPMDAGRQGFAEFYTSGLYAESVHDELCRFIAEVGHDRFEMADLKKALEGNRRQRDVRAPGSAQRAVAERPARLRPAGGRSSPQPLLRRRGRRGLPPPRSL